MPIKIEYDKKALRAAWEAFFNWFVLIGAFIGFASFVTSVLFLTTNICNLYGDTDVDVIPQFIPWWGWVLISLPCFIWLFYGIICIIKQIIKWFQKVFKITRVKKEFDVTKCKNYLKCYEQFGGWSLYKGEGYTAKYKIYNSEEESSQVSQDEFIENELTQYTCDDCGDFIEENNMGMRIYALNDKHYTVCKDCYKENYKYCTRCGVPITGARYSDTENSFNYCEKCYFEEFEHE